jgi:superfamily II DNA or RNA helicase
LTSKVLNEGVDVPDANVGVILSGNGSIREHVQRLGRILRKREGKRASLYEICTAVAAEGRISERRRQHSAYQRGEPPVHHHLPSPEELARQLAEQAEQDAAYEPSFTDEIIVGEESPC